MDEGTRQLLHNIVAELVEHLFLPGVHNTFGVQQMSDRLHKQIDEAGVDRAPVV